MFGDLDKYLLAFLTGLATTYCLTPVIRRLAVKYGVVDKPDARRPHNKTTARGGGLALIIGFHVACLIFFLFPWPTRSETDMDLIWWRHFLAASLVLLAVGVIDDIRGMRPLVKLCGQILAASLMWYWGARFGFLLGYKLPDALDFMVTVFWLVAIINAFNLIDGLDGLASGLASISAAGLCGVLLMQNRSGEVVLLFGFIGACLGFLRYNFHPASIFLGDTGSMFLGFTLGVVSLHTFNKNSFLISMTIPVMVLGVPIYDALLAIWRRTVRSWVTGKGGIMQPDVEHLHHRLRKSGVSTQHVATLLYVLNAAFVILGLSMMFFQSRRAGIFLVALLIGVYVLMRQLAAIELRETGRALLMGLQRPAHPNFKALVNQAWDLACLAIGLAAVMWVVEGVRGDFWKAWFVELPLWVVPTFSLLALSRTYITYWQRARLRDVLMVVFWLEAGILCSLALALLVEPAETHKWLLRAVLLASISHPPIIASRMFYRSLEELMTWLKRSQTDAGTEQVLLYGSGLRAEMYLRDRAAKTVNQSDGRRIIGFIDDEKVFHFQWIYGLQVLGGLEQLPHIIEQNGIQHIIVVTDLAEEHRLTLKEIAAKNRVNLSEWLPAEQPISLRAPSYKATPIISN